MFVKEIGKNFEYLTNILLQFLRFGDIEIPIVIHILKTSVWILLDEMFSDVKIPVYRRANFPSIHIDRSHFWGPVHSGIE